MQTSIAQDRASIPQDLIYDGYNNCISVLPLNMSRFHPDIARCSATEAAACAMTAAFQTGSTMLHAGPGLAGTQSLQPPCKDHPHDACGILSRIRARIGRCRNPGATPASGLAQTLWPIMTDDKMSAVFDRHGRAADLECLRSLLCMAIAADNGRDKTAGSDRWRCSCPHSCAA